MPRLSISGQGWKIPAIQRFCNDIRPAVTRASSPSRHTNAGSYIDGKSVGIQGCEKPEEELTHSFDLQDSNLVR